MVDTYIAQNGRLPKLQITFTDGDGDAVDLSSATAVTFTMWDIAGTVVIDAAACDEVDAAAGQFEYAWVAEDTATAGDFFGRFTATIGGLPMPAPNDRAAVVCITATPEAAA
jgi:hypothetical protein